MNISLFKKADAVVAEIGGSGQCDGGVVDLNALLMSCDRYGEIRVSRITGGWYSSIDMNTNTTGAQFKIASEFKHKTPVDAVTECIKRMNEALATLGGAK